VKIHKVVWLEQFVEKIEGKHGVGTREAEEVLWGDPHIRRARKGHVKGQDVYAAYGKTGSGRLVLVAFVYKGQGSALPISARDMTAAERRYYDEQNEAIRPYPK
jgi:hypothetical protein